MSATVTPHDALFKKFMSQPVLARQFLDICAMGTPMTGIRSLRY